MAERLEIIAGLKSAIERGYSLEFAEQSFINAGYSRQDVEDSARVLSSGIFSSSTTQTKPQQETQVSVSTLRPIQIQEKTQPQITQKTQQPQTIQHPIIQINQNFQAKPEKNKSKKTAILIIILFIILLILITGLLITIFKKEWITDLLNSFGLISD